MGYYLQYLLIRFVALLMGVFPVSFLIWCTRRAGDLMFVFMGRRKKVVLENINQALGDSVSSKEKVEIGRMAFQNMAVSLVELFVVERTKIEVKDRFNLIGKEYLDQAFERGKGVVLVISHLGSWEYLSFLPYITGKSWSVVVKKIKNPKLNDYIDKLRRVMTVNPIEKVNSMRPIMKELKKNNGIAILIDQWAGGEGLWLDFFNVSTSTTSIPSRLAKKTDCALIPAYCIRKDMGKYEIQIHAPVQMDPANQNWERETTETLNTLLEDQIRKYPEQWLWAHRRWKKKPSQMRQP